MAALVHHHPAVCGVLRALDPETAIADDLGTEYAFVVEEPGRVAVVACATGYAAAHPRSEVLDVLDDTTSVCELAPVCGSDDAPCLNNGKCSDLRTNATVAAGDFYCNCTANWMDKTGGELKVPLPGECPDDQPGTYGCGCGEELVDQPPPYDDTQCCAHSPNVGCGCGIKRDAAAGCCPDDIRVPTFSDANPGGKIAVGQRCGGDPQDGNGEFVPAGGCACDLICTHSTQCWSAMAPIQSATHGALPDNSSLRCTTDADCDAAYECAAIGSDYMNCQLRANEDGIVYADGNDAAGGAWTATAENGGTSATAVGSGVGILVVAAALYVWRRRTRSRSNSEWHTGDSRTDELEWEDVL